MDPIQEARYVVEAAERRCAPRCHQIGGYEILRIIRRGGMGIVYLAREKTSQKIVALKTIRSDQVTATRRALFHEEIQNLANLRHPHIAALYHAGLTEDEVPYFAMEYIEGVSPSTFSERHGPKAGLRVLLEICSGVQHAHTKGLVHCDLKLANVRVGRDGRAKVLDFGIAAALQREARRRRDTETLRPRGTVGYMSPEYGAEWQPDTRADVFSLGVVGTEIATGQRVPGGRPRDYPTRFRDLFWVFSKACRENPDDRYDSVAALADDITRCLDRRTVRARRMTPPYALTRMIQRKPLRTIVSLLLMTVLALAFTTHLQARQAELAVTTFQSAWLWTWSSLGEWSNERNVETIENVFPEEAARLYGFLGWPKARGILEKTLKQRSLSPEDRAVNLYRLARTYAYLGELRGEDASEPRARELAIEAQRSSGHLSERQRRRLKWLLLALEVPGLASDLDGDPTVEDLWHSAELAFDLGQVRVASKLYSLALEQAATRANLKLRADVELRRAGTFWLTGRLEEGIRLLRTTPPQGSDGRFEARNSLSVLLRDSRAFDEAESLMENLLLACEHEPKRLRRVKNNLARLHEMRGDRQRALELFQEVVGGMTGRKWDSDYSPFVALEAAEGIARIRLHQGDVQSALALMKPIVEIRARHHSRRSYVRVTAEALLGECLVRSGSRKEGLALLRESAEILRGALGPEALKTRQLEAVLRGLL